VVILGGVAVLALAAIVIGVIVYAASRGDDGPAALSPANVASHPDQYYNQTISVTGTFNEKLGARAFAFEGVLVITPEDVPATVKGGQVISVSGIVRPFDQNTTTAAGEIPAGSPALDGWRDQPMLIATTVEYQ
jgi:hypothetical protein